MYGAHNSIGIAKDELIVYAGCFEHHYRSNELCSLRAVQGVRIFS
jgi:hypothetical protein